MIMASILGNFDADIPKNIEIRLVDIENYMAHKESDSIPKI